MPYMRIAFLIRNKQPLSSDSLLRQPLDDMQTSLLQLARALAAREHEVLIFCHCQTPGSDGGVALRPIAELPRFARQQPLDALVAVAGEQDLKLGIAARVTLWWSLEDFARLRAELPDARAEIGGLLATRADRLMVPSAWHAAQLAERFKLPPAHFQLAPLGITVADFGAEPAPAAPQRLIALAPTAPELASLLAGLAALRVDWPELELHLYAGLPAAESPAPADAVAAETLYQHAGNTPGVVAHAPLPAAELAVALSQGSLLLMPNLACDPVNSPSPWARSLSLAVLQAQAAGLPVIASAYGALAEAISDGETGKLIDGVPGTPAYDQALIDAARALLQAPAARERMAASARRQRLAESDWNRIAAGWEALLGEDFVSSRQSQAPEVSPFPSPKISVIIPTYNRARNLRHCLESLTWQDEKAFEVIICDDGSSDDSREVAEAFRSRLNLRYRWQEDLGFRAAEARNLGLRIARGKLILFLDSDLVIPPDFIRSHAEAHTRWGKQKVVVNSFVWRMLESCDEDLGLPPAEYIPRHQDILKPDNRTRFNAFERNEPVEETYYLDSNAFSIKREDLELVGGFDPDFIGWGHEDTELGYRVNRHGFRLALIRADAYHLYHYIPETKDAERAVNWKRLTVKHGITRWYHPLWELPIEAPVLCFDDSGALSVLQPAAWVLKTGYRLPMGGVYFRLVVEAGVLTAIDEMVPPGSPAPAEL